jgi:hypothetical protein
MCVFLCEQFPTFPVAENPIGSLNEWQRYTGALTVPYIADNRLVAMVVPPNGRYVTLVGGQSEGAGGHVDRMSGLLALIVRTPGRAPGDLARIAQRHPPRRHPHRPERMPYGYRALVSSVIEGGASPGALPQLRFGLSPISRTSVPPPAISPCENHGLSSGLPLSSAD